jgi:hypothetical protein
MTVEESKQTAAVPLASDTTTRYSFTKGQLVTLTILEVAITSAMVWGAFKAGTLVARGHRGNRR